MQQIRITNYLLLFFILFIESVGLFVFSPRHYVYDFNLFCMLQYLLSTFLFFRAKKKKNYFDFDTIFLFAFFFVMFFYPVFIYPNDPTKYFAFQYEFNENVISRSTALSLLGIQSYFLGSISYRKSLNENKKSVDVKSDTNIILLSIISVLTFILYILSGGYAKLKGEYSGEEAEASGAAAYLYVFFPVFLLCAISFQFNKLLALNNKNLKLKNINKILIICFSLIFIMLIMAGSRTIPLQLLLLCGGVYTLFYKQIGFFKFFPLVVAGVLAMFAVNVMRGGAEGINDLADIVMDLIICNRNTYLSVDYVDIHGVTYGKSMLSPVLASIPFLQNIVFSIFSINPSDAGSAVFFTKLTLGENSSLGLGTNIIADLYLAFGIYGVIFFMFLLGRGISKFIFQSSTSIYALIIYSVMMSYSVFIVRAEFFYFSRYLLWSVFTCFFIKLYHNSNKPIKQ